LNIEAGVEIYESKTTAIAAEGFPR
jgi:hypothetical protein